MMVFQFLSEFAIQEKNDSRLNVEMVTGNL